MGVLTHAIGQVGRGASKAKDLTAEEAQSAMDAILSGKADPFELGAFLVAMRIKEESADELAAFVEVASRHLTRVPGPPPAVTIPSYAGKRQTFPALIAAACLLSACGVKVGLHGHGRPMDRMSLADAIEALGGNPLADADRAAEDLARAGVAYVGVERFCSPMHDGLELRHRMGLRSCFHTMGRLINPFGAPNMMVGLSHDRTFEKFARAGHKLGYNTIVAFRGLEGEAETNPLTAVEGTVLHSDGSVGGIPIDPKALGYGNGSRTHMQVENAEQGAQMVRDTLDRKGPEEGTATVVLTAALGMVAAGVSPDPFMAAERAREALESGAAREVLGTWLGT